MLRVRESHILEFGRSIPVVQKVLEKHPANYEYLRRIMYLEETRK